MTEQLTYFKLGLRTSSIAGNSIMWALVRAFTDKELKGAVDYYAGLRRPRTSVIKDDPDAGAGRDVTDLHDSAVV